MATSTANFVLWTFLSNYRQHLTETCFADKCQECQDIFKQFQEELSDPLVQRDIMDFFNFMCSLQEHPLDDFCNELVEDVIPKVIERLLSADPFVTCKKLWFC